MKFIRHINYTIYKQFYAPVRETYFRKCNTIVSVNELMEYL